jgi:predicted DNA-binding transcriptional regulator AlpA
MVAEGKKSRTVTLDEWAREVGIGRSAAYELARQGKLPGLIKAGDGTAKLGGRYLVSRAAMERMLEGREEKAPMA